MIEATGMTGRMSLAFPAGDICYDNYPDSEDLPFEITFGFSGPLAVTVKLTPAQAEELREVLAEAITEHAAGRVKPMEPEF
jgi:hypothetical protein